jgi:hypothetical protein
MERRNKQQGRRLRGKCAEVHGKVVDFNWSASMFSVPSSMVWVMFPNVPKLDGSGNTAQEEPQVIQ